MTDLTLSPAQKAWQTRRARALLAGGSTAVVAPIKRQAVVPVEPMTAKPHGMSIEAFAKRVMGELSANELRELRNIFIAATKPPPRVKLAGTKYADYLAEGAATSQWPSYVIDVLFADGRRVRASFTSNPKHPVNAGHAMRLVAGFYRADRAVRREHGFEDEVCPNGAIKYTNRDTAIPLPAIDDAFIADAVTCKELPREGLLDVLNAAMVRR